MTKNNRRVLWCTLDVDDTPILIASVHNDSFNGTNRLRQTHQILEFVGNRPALLAGDFNARPDEPPMQLIRDSQRFVGAFDGPATFPAKKPVQTIDYILAPGAWTLIDHRVIETDASDHLPVVSTFRLQRDSYSGNSAVER